MAITPDDMTPEQAAEAVWQFEEVLAWIEWYMCGRNDKLADYINQTLRTDMSMLHNELMTKEQTNDQL
jgi:hypothetical protein